MSATQNDASSDDQMEFEADGYTPEDVEVLRPKLNKIRKLEDQKDAIAQKINTEYEDCKSLGWDRKGLKAAIQSEPKDVSKRRNYNRSFDAACEALGIKEQLDITDHADKDNVH